MSEQEQSQEQKYKDAVRTLDFLADENSFLADCSRYPEEKIGIYEIDKENGHHGF
jgi:hypothetical protein